MKFLALKEIPNGTPPGEVFEATEAQGDVLILCGAARKLLDPEVDELHVHADRSVVDALQAPARSPRGRFQRKDLAAVEN